MKSTTLFIFVLFISSFSSFAQTTVDIIETTFKIKANSEEIFYYGFAKGDQIILNFSEVDNKEIKEVEVAEYPNNLIFQDYKTNAIDNKTLQVNSTAVYSFKFNNSALAGRVCKLKIQRIYKSEESKNFNSTVLWRNGVDTIVTSKKEKYLVKSDTSIVNLMDQVAKVSSKNAINGNSNNAVVEFTLPENTISWSYFIGVGNEGKEVYNRSKDRLISTAISFASKFSGYGTMAALALYGINTFTQAQGGDNVKFFLFNDKANLQLFKDKKSFSSIKQGDVLSDAAQMKNPLKGSLSFILINDNLLEPIDVIVKITAVTITQEWGIRPLIELKDNGKKLPYLQN